MTPELKPRPCRPTRLLESTAWSQLRYQASKPSFQPARRSFTWETLAGYWYAIRDLDSVTLEDWAWATFGPREIVLSCPCPPVSRITFRLPMD